VIVRFCIQFTTLKLARCAVSHPECIWDVNLLRDPCLSHRTGPDKKTRQDKTRVKWWLLEP